MSKYRKKPVEIEAFKWTGDADQIEDPEWIVEAIKKGKIVFGVDEELKATCMYIDIGGVLQSERGVQKANIGDYIIRDVIGIYPCKQEVFEMAYEKC